MYCSFHSTSLCFSYFTWYLEPSWRNNKTKIVPHIQSPVDLYHCHTYSSDLLPLSNDPFPFSDVFSSSSCHPPIYTTVVMATSLELQCSLSCQTPFLRSIVPVRLATLPLVLSLFHSDATPIVWGHSVLVWQFPFVFLFHVAPLCGGQYHSAALHL